MEEHELLIVDWINHLAGAPEGEHLISMQVIMATIVLIFSIGFFGFLRSRFSMENPGKLQQAFEVAVEYIGDQMEEIIGHGGRRYLAVVGTIGIFILFSNMLGLVPGLAAPTSNINVPAGCAIFVFLYYNAMGVKRQGLVNYLKHFMGPAIWLAPIMIPIEIISHIARPFSLTVRLFANIFAEESLVLAFFALIPLFVPLPFMAYAVFGGLLQAFIFITLTMVYLAGAVATEDH